MGARLRLWVREYFRECKHSRRVSSYGELKQLMSDKLRGEVTERSRLQVLLK